VWLNLTSVRGPTLAAVLGYIWPKGDWKGKFLICVSMLALCFAKWLNILVPFALKRAVDALEAQQSTLGASGAAVVMSVGGPLLGAYVAARLGVSLANEARSVAFAGVLQTAARRFSLDLFDALHSGDAAFHLANPTGALSTSFARAVRSAESRLPRPASPPLPRRLLPHSATRPFVCVSSQVRGMQSLLFQPLGAAKRAALAATELTTLSALVLEAPSCLRTANLWSPNQSCCLLSGPPQYNPGTSPRSRQTCRFRGF
jgi:ABC-type multidrug transport system fused ATPase/permease subunit